MLRMLRVLAIGMLILLVPGSSASAQDDSDDNFDVSDWAGRYVGFIDGRPASLLIRHSGPGISSCEDSVNGRRISGSWFSVFLADLERDVEWSRTCISQFHKGSPRDHRWRNMRLENEKTGEVDNVGTFYLHTWDKSFISGWSEWRGRRFGRLFVRADRGIDQCDWPSHLAEPTCEF